MVTLTKLEKLRKDEQAKGFKPLMDELTQCSGEEFVEKLKGLIEWDRSKDDLYTWIPVLNRIDAMLGKLVENYSYKGSDPKKQPVRLTVMKAADEDVAVGLMGFTCRLLNNSSNRPLYSSLDVMADLLNCPNYRIKLAATKVIATFGECQVISRQKIDSKSAIGTPDVKRKILDLALAIPSSSADDSMNHFALSDLFFDKKAFPSKWSRVAFSYYIESSKKTHNASSSGRQANTSLRRFILGPDELKSMTLQQIFDKGMAEIPPDRWYDFSLQASVAKAFSDNTFDNLQLRIVIIQTKFNAIAFTNIVYIPPQVSSKLFEVDPYAFNNLADFLSLSEQKIPRDLRLDALFALECISLKHIWCSDIMRNLGGNMSHGLLFQILRYISKVLRDDTNAEIDNEYNVRFSYLISNIADVKSLQESLIGAGLISNLLEVISIRDCPHKRTLSSAAHLLEVVVDDADAATEFITNNGFNVLIESLNDEVHYALDHPEMAKPPKYSTVYYSISFRQLTYIRSLLKLVLKLLKTDSGDRIRNLIDSPILQALNRILANRPTFGYTLVTYSLDVIQTVINTEPTIYSVLVESETIPYIIDHFEEFLGPSGELLCLLPEVISALSLNADGLKRVREKHLIDCLFQITTTPEYAKLLSWDDNAFDLGSSIDELARHYPDLKPDIEAAFHKTIKALPKILKFDHPYVYKSSTGKGEFYLSKNEEVIDNEEGSKEIESGEVQVAAAVADCFSAIFYGMTLENVSWAGLAEKVDIKELLSVVILEKPPYDYVGSQTLLNFSDILKMFDDERRNYALPALLERLSQSLESVREFLDFGFERSYVLSTPYDKLEETLRELSIINVILYIITDTYVNIASLFPIRVLQILEFFEQHDFSLIRNLRLLFQRCALEEMFIRDRLPPSVVAETAVRPIGNTPPILIHAAKPTKDEAKDDKTSAKFKNTLQDRHLFIQIQSWSSMLFRCFLRLTHARKMSIESNDRALEIRVFETTVDEIINMLDLRYLETHMGYFLVVFNFVTFAFTFPNVTTSAGGTIQTIPALLFCQNGGFKIYFEAVKKLFDYLETLKSVEKLEKIEYIKDSPDVLAVTSLINLLSFINKCVQLDSMENIKNTSEYYPYDEIQYNITISLMVSVKILSLGLISEITEEYELFQNDERRLPYSVFKQLLSLLKNIYNNSFEDESYEAYQLHWDLIPPSQRKVAMLQECGISEDVARGYLEEEKDDLPIYERPDVFSETEWEKYLELKRSGNWKTDLELLDSQYKDNSNVDDLSKMRIEFYQGGGMLDRMLELLPLYPKLVNAISHTLLQMLKEMHESPTNVLENLLVMMKETDLESASSLASVIHLFGILLNNKEIYEVAEAEIKEFVSYLTKSLRPEYVNTAWFSKALYVYEIIFAKSESPKVEQLSGDWKECANSPFPSTFNAIDISHQAKEEVFDVLIRVNEISDFYSALAVSRILILYARNESFAQEVAKSGVLATLLKVIGLHQKSEKINYLESSFLLLARRCFENSDIVKSLIRHELNRAFTSRAIADNKEKSRDLAGLLSEKASVVLREPNLFINCLSETTRFENFLNPKKLDNLSVKRYPSECDVEMQDAFASSEEKVTLKNRTGIVHLLFTQLMAAFKKDWANDPSSNEELVDDLHKKDGQNVSRNPVCGYMIFLLKVLIELVGSYKESKFEFLTFNKRNLYAEAPKPRTTALNFILYQLLDTDDRNQEKASAERREVISKLARDLIVSFASSVQDERTQRGDPKIVDPDMTFIRKFTIESIGKAFREATKTPKTLESNVGKLYGWFHLLSSLLGNDVNYLHSVLDPNKVFVDRYQIGKLMIEMGIPCSITDCIASLDLNYPFSKKLFNASIEPLNAINEVRSRFSALFKLENIDDEEEVDDESEKEENADMFRNSALGMYDVDDIEEDDDDDASLIGEDEDIAFVEGDDDGLEVVFSEDDLDGEQDSDDLGSDHSLGSEDVDDSDGEMDYNIAGPIQVSLSSQESSFGSREVSDTDESSYFTDEEGPMNMIEIDEYGSDSAMDENFDDISDIDESDWESGLSELSGSDEDNSEGSIHEGVPPSDRWLADENDVDDESDGNGRGVSSFQWVFAPDQQPFRVHDRSASARRGSHHHHLGRRSGFSMVSPSISILNGGRRAQSILLNPLGPSGLEEVENGIVNQLNEVGIPGRSRTDATHLSDVLFGGEFFDEKTSAGIYLKSTTARWNDIFEMFYDSKIYVNNCLPTIFSRIFEPSSVLYIKKREEALQKQSEQRFRREEELKKQMDAKKRKLEDMQNEPEIADSQHEETTQHEPIIVSIGGEDVDIAGTDIDPEFLNALPDEMRAEVFAQHVRERRAEAQHHPLSSREIDSDFLEAIPENIREEILEQEAAESRFSRLVGALDEREPEEGESDGEHDEVIEDGEQPKSKASERCYFSPLVDRAGIAAIMRSVFIAQPYLAREAHHELFFRLCSSKQNRNDVVNYLLLILTEGITDTHSLEKVYNLISSKAVGPNKGGPPTRQLPIDCTPLSVANQTIEILQNLVETGNKLKFFFITEHENLLVNRSSLKNKKDLFTKNMKWPINHLFGLLDKKIITDEAVLLDFLTRTLQICTKPISTIAKSLQENAQRKFLLPEIEEKHLESIVSIIKYDSCNTKVFQQTLNVMLNLLVMANAQEKFTQELSHLAQPAVRILSDDVNTLSKKITDVENGSEINYEIIQKFTVPSSEQAKLLKVLTATDYIHANKKHLTEIEVEKLMKLYDSMKLGNLWSALSNCLTQFEERPNITSSASILLPLIESLMVVCKHSKVRDSKELLRYESKKSDFAQIAAENTFFAFTDLHKKILNQMIRSNPKLMNGPFALLVRNPRILDFDNKRYYFVARIKSGGQERPKLSISVRRNEVFLDSYRALFFKSNDEIKSSKLEITFKGEAGVDAGGVTREWYQVLSRQMFNPDYALFLPVASDKTTFHPNRTSGVNPEHLSFFKFIGMIIGKAISDQCFLDCHFSREVYKNILGKPVSLKDMESLDLDYYKSLIWILENDITGIIEETFSVETDDYGEHKIIDLIPDGRDIAVTEDCKQEYVQKIVEYKLHTSVKEQMDNFLLGFYAVIPKELIAIFDEQELELLISGLPDIDVDDWKNNTVYVNYTATCKQISHFWRAVRSFDTEERAKLLQFVTGTSKVPLNGFRELSGVNGISKFSIHRDYGSTERLPSSHTCFNQLDLPAYSSYETLRGSLLLAINEGHEGFGIA
ncbi:LAMI_0G10814g1_1 [Lachancea mirantina]|uniref:HECT-type E3 ubiquitin transferase n=1 Tax=Lachancea mirantina TaxID=1230905 RepID=A0A1G4KAU1_9SACH|nr:LAMI_0G10814g1_1 [Lachancea mirantina]